MARHDEERILIAGILYMFQAFVVADNLPAEEVVLPFLFRLGHDYLAAAHQQLLAPARVLLRWQIAVFIGSCCCGKTILHSQRVLLWSLIDFTENCEPRSLSKNYFPFVCEDLLDDFHFVKF